MKSGQLKEIIRSLVAAELRVQLPALVEHVLTEKYIRKLMTENNSAKSKIERSLSERLSDNDDKDEDDSYDNYIPRPMNNSDKGIYDARPLARGKSQVSEGHAKLLSADNPLAFVYSDVHPIPKNGAMLDEGISLNTLDKKLGTDFSKMRAMAGISNDRPSQESSVKRINDKELDRVVDTRNGGSMNNNIQSARSNGAVHNTHDMIDGQVFPNRPIILNG